MLKLSIQIALTPRLYISRPSLMSDNSVQVVEYL